MSAPSAKPPSSRRLSAPALPLTVPKVLFRFKRKSPVDAALASVGASKKLYTYGYVFNGFAADLTPAQAQKLALTAGVSVAINSHWATNTSASASSGNSTPSRMR